MEVSQQDLIKIVEQASTISERLGDRFIPNQAQNEKLISSRMELWSKVVAQGNPDQFNKRFVWDGINTNTVINVLGDVCLADEQQLPTWTEILREALSIDLNREDSDVYRCLDPEEPIPFEEVYLPFVEVGRKKFIAQVGVSGQLLSEIVHINLERQLLLKLDGLCTESLQFEFSLFKNFKQSPLNFLQERLQTNDGDQQYQSFVQDLKAGKLLSFFQKYSVLARLVGTAVDFWAEEKAEFLQRLASDLPMIEQTFQEDITQVVAIGLGLSDLHNRGRSVISLTFASGLKLIYKPRGLGLEVAYFQLLAWCNQQEILLPFKLLKVIDCKTHGWMEYVEHLPCQETIAAQRYYQRAGMLLCLLYILEATDCHQENIIASGEHPVLVDLETLLHPHSHEIDPNKEAGVQYLANQQFFDSVIATGLLPKWEVGADGGIAEDISGLGGVDEQIPVEILTWKNINTDNMVLGAESLSMPPQTNALLLNGITLSPHDYANEIIDGCQQMYQFLSERREVLLAADSPIANLSNQKVRFLFRPTEVYALVLSKIMQPKFLRHGVEYSIELDVLSRSFLSTDTKPSLWSLLKMELQALEQMDIPYFKADSSSDALRLNPDVMIEGCFYESSYDLVISHLQQLNDADLAKQISMIRACLYSLNPRQMISVAPVEDNTNNLDLDTQAPLTSAQLVEEAVEIAQQLQKLAIHATDGSVTWIGMGYHPQAMRLQLQPLGHSLYDGICGVALFLAALSKITGEQEFRNLALSALQHLTKVLHDQDLNFRFRITKQIGIGGGIGVGSIIYTLVKVSQFLDQPELLDTAVIAASLITKESIADDHQFDTMSGSAGAILGLLTLYDANQNPVILEQALECGYHLLDHRSLSKSGFRAWATLEEQLATGISHGAAGIAYALARLYKTTQEKVFLEAAEEAIAYERSVFSPTTGNWSDMTSWCHGAPGIGLARLGTLEVIDTTEIRQEIEVALNTTEQFGLQKLDHLCCGNFGRMELLLVAGSKLSRSHLCETGRKQAAQVVGRVKQTGAFYLFPEFNGDIYNPGFFQGTAGIGYELIRLAYPEALPSVLMWE
ncbi:MAG: type 2 lantipeptide synthetase LanM [Symploca sp. SIO1C4]|uniref:Type 2 lantipeptide synthetase LanM n=1 Tax=Symploca sp. SIO1C4 TaxID=2607765 RepID=A0A6B3N6S5_9CYAN|nr:type 2 lantipeptide synthetase LanM [Symploca sp. SIO1C4]